MNTKERNRKIALLSIVVAVAVIVSCALGIFIDVALPKEYKEPSISIDKTAGSAIAVDYPDPSGLGQFKNGFKYVYTDKDKVDGFRAGTEQYDVSTQEVNTSMPRGSKENPYVIASVGDWEKFAKMVGPTTSTRGLNEYFVLAADLDFSGVTFRPIPRFAGNFHGLGFTLSNINCSSWVYWNGSSWVAFGTTTSAGFGVFGRTDSATITDLILQDYYFTGMPNTESLTWSNYQGGLVGTICGNDSILNCHLQGEIDGGNNSYPNYGWSGPIVAFLYKATSSDTNVIIYRCTANTVMSISPNAEKNFHTGGIIGDSNNGVNLKISDCTSYFNFTNNTGYGHTGGIMGYMRESGRVSVENIVSTYYYSGRYIAGGGICALHTNTNNLKLIKNTYVHAAKGGVGSTGAMNAAEAAPQSSSNLHFGPYVNTTPITSPVPTKHSSVSALFDAAKNSVGSGTDKLPEQIWDREKITEEVTPDTSPVRNYLVATLTFKNLLSGGNEEGVGLDDADFMPGEELPKPEASYLADKEAAHHVFKGWTLDASGNSEPFNALPTGVFAEQTVYAVWGVDTKETTDITATGGTSSGSYSASAVYGDTIKLQSSVSVSVMTDMQYTLQWKLNGDEVKTAKAKSYTVRNVKESGDYTFDYVFYSQGEPLWRGKGTSSQTYDAEITPAPLKLKSFDTTKTGYKGMSYSDSAFKPKPVIVMQSDESVVVDGTSEWTIAMGIVGGGVQESVNGDKITKNFKFTPDEKYNGNYGSSVFFDGTYTMQYVKMIFKIPSLNNETMEVDLIYNDPLTYKNVVDLFQDEFKKYMLDPNYSGLFVGMTPAFVKDGNKININDYKKQSGNAYAAVTSNIEIEVGFVTGEYTVSFDPANGGSVTTLPDKVKYNVKLTAPTEPSNGDKLFMGWYYDTGEVDEKNNAIMKKWDFDEDRVTGDLALVASWLEADTLKSLTVTLTGKRPLIAGMKLSGDDLKVMANFIGTVNGETIEQSMELTWSEYGKSLQYDSRSWDGNLHLYADGSDSTIIDAVNLVKISYTFTNKKGETSNAEYTLSVTVLPIDKTEELHDVKNINLGQDADNNVVMEVDGTPKNLPELPKSQYSKFNVKNITYEYRDYTGQILQPEDVIEAGRYTVRVIFEMASPDYHADVLIIYLTLGELSNIRIEWEYDASQPLVYNGQAQTPDFKIYDENNNDVTDQLKDKLTFSGDYDKTDVGEYTFSVAISGDYKIESGATCSYKIAKAILNIPTLKADGEIIYDGMPKNV
ncbi:MAG: InlB B-repeat-containing protein, partial [Clostridia bacterium]|nr:InlB B-repeat-containing protein [Clostridia bacterium]